MLWEFSRGKTGLEYLETLLYYLFNAAPHLEKESFIKEFHKFPNPELLEEVIMPTLAQQWIEEGIEKGRQEGESQIVWKLLKMKFQNQAEDYRKRLETLSSEELERVAEKIITTQTIEDVFK